MLERQLQATVIAAARTFGWADAWTWRSVHSPKGWPDLFLARGLDLIVAELKTDKGKTTPEQDRWLDWWRNFAREIDYATEDSIMAGRPAPPRIRVFVWRPADLNDIYKILARR